MTEKHPIEKLWDLVTREAVDGSMTGKHDVPKDGAATGRMTFDLPDGTRWSVYVDRVAPEGRGGNEP
jgi:hypothetical protein